MLNSSGTYYFLIVLLGSLIPALTVGLIRGRHDDDPARRVILGMNFDLAGGMSTYLICGLSGTIVFGLLVNFAGIETKTEVYELALTLQGPPAAIETFRGDIKDLQVSFRSVDNPGHIVTFSNFVMDGSGKTLRSRVSTAERFSAAHFSKVAIVPERTGSIVLQLSPDNLTLGHQIEAVLRVAPETEAKRGAGATPR
jgi:hypothetical protein